MSPVERYVKSDWKKSREDWSVCVTCRSLSCKTRSLSAFIWRTVSSFRSARNERNENQTCRYDHNHSKQPTTKGMESVIGSLRICTLLRELDERGGPLSHWGLDSKAERTCFENVCLSDLAVDTGGISMNRICRFSPTFIGAYHLHHLSTISSGSEKVQARHCSSKSTWVSRPSIPP